LYMSTRPTGHATRQCERASGILHPWLQTEKKRCLLTFAMAAILPPISAVSSNFPPALEFLRLHTVARTFVAVAAWWILGFQRKKRWGGHTNCMAGAEIRLKTAHAESCFLYGITATAVIAVITCPSPRTSSFCFGRVTFSSEIDILQW